MALSSYDELVKQVASLKSENCHLRRELQDNSSHLTKLENDASNMKDVLSHMQVTFGEHELADHQLSEECRNEMGTDDYNDEDPALTSHTSLCDDSFEDDAGQGQAIASGLEEGETSMTESAAESHMADVFGLIQKLDSERKQLLQELERDEQHRHWFNSQMKTITQKMESLQHSEKNTVQADIARHQLETEAQKVQGAMLEKLGSGEQGKLRQEARLDRIRSIEAEIKSLQSSRSMKDAATSTMLTKDVFDIKPEQEDGVGGFASERTVTRNGQSVSLATQTGEVVVKESHDGIAPGIPLSSNLQVMYHGAWPIDKGVAGSSGSYPTPPISQDLASVISFNSTNTNSSGSIGAGPGTSQPMSAAPGAGEPPQQLGTKVEMVYSLLSMLGTHDKDDMSRTLFAMSQSQDSCIAMRQSGCLPLLLQLLHGSEKDSGLLGKTRGSKSARARAAAALHNIVHCHHDDKRGRRESRTLRLLEQIRAYCDQQRGESEDDDEEAVVNNYAEADHHPGEAIVALMKLSFDEDYRHAICTLGGLQAIAELLEIDNRMTAPLNDYSTTIRKYSCMALTNLTFGDGKNKALLCSMRGAMEALTDQLCSGNEDLIQSAASVLRNLSWRADLASKKALREIGAVTALMKAAMSVKKDTTLKSILSALWNLSSHCSENKGEICAVEGALQFLVGLLTYKSSSKTLAIVENGGGILRNISSHIAVREDYRQILRKHDCLKILLLHLRSPSLSVVSNACGTLWNLSARCEEDQNALWEMGAVNMLRNLVHSRHKMISTGSSAALRNLLSSNPAGKAVDSDKSVEFSPRPSLHVRKQRALEAELDSNLSETCENVESPRNSPTEVLHRSESEPRRFMYSLNGTGNGGSSSGDGGRRKDENIKKHVETIISTGSENVDGQATSSSGQVVRAGSQDSVGSTHSDISHDRTRVHTMLAKSSSLLHKRQGSSLERKDQQVIHSATPRPNKTRGAVPEHRLQNTLANNGVAIVNNTPAHVRQSQGAIFHHPQYHHNQSWQTLPNSRIVQYMHEVAMYAGVEPSGNFHGHSSLTQSAPSHLFHHFCMNNSQHEHQTPPEWPVKSSSALGNFNNMNVANSSTISKDFSNHLNSAEEETDQPVNYSLKYQDVACTERGGKSSSMHVPYANLASVGSALNFHSGTLPEHMRSNIMTTTMTNHIYSANSSNISDKIPTNARQTVKIPGSNSIMNPSIVTQNRPVPNMGYNRFHTPRGYLSTGSAVHPPQFVTPSVTYPTGSPFHSAGYLCSSGHSVRAPTTNHPARVVASSVGFAPQGKIFNTNADQFHTLQVAHQNVSHLRSLHQFSTYAETDLDLVVDQPTDFSLRYSEVSEENCGEDYQEQPINYSLRFRDGGGRESQDMGVYRDERHCVECKYAEARRTNERIDSSANDDQVRTFCTEGTPYLSTATSLTDLTQAGKHEGDDENVEHTHSGDGTGDKLNVDMKMNGSRTEINATTGSSCSQTTDRHTSSTLVGTSRSSGILTCQSKSSSQMSDSHRIQQNFHSDTNEGALDQTKTYCEEGTPVCFSRVSSLSSLHGTVPRDSDGGQMNSSEKVELVCINEAETPQVVALSVIENKGAVCPSSKFASSLRRANADQVIKGERESKTVTFDENNQVEETPLMFSRSSSPESLSSFDTQSVHSSVISEYSRRASEVVSPSEIPDSPSESMPPSPKQTHSPTRRFKEFLPNPKSVDAISKQSLDFDKNPRTVKVELFSGYAGFDEEDKPINFAMRNPEMAHLHTFPGFDDDQPINFSCVDREQEQSDLAFSAYQRSIHPPTSNPGGPPLVNRLLTPRAKTMPTLVEQSVETESSSGKSEVPVVYADEGTPPNFSETTSLSGLTMASSSTRGTGQKLSILQHQVQEPDLLKAESEESGPEVARRIEAPSVPAVIGEDVHPGVWPPTTEQLKQEDRDASMSDVSEGEEGILAECINSGMPTPVSSTRKARRTSSDSIVKKKSGIPMKMNHSIHSKNSPKASSAYKMLPKKPQSSGKTPPDDAKSDTSSVENEDLLLSQMIQSAMPKNTPGRKFSSGPSHSEGVGDNVRQSSRDSKTTTFVPRTSNLTIVAPFNDFIPTDTVRVYNVEGTPGNFSATTSLSDLTVDSEGSKSGLAGLYGSPKAGKSQGSDGRISGKQTPSKLRLPATIGHKSSSKGRSNSKLSMPLLVPRDGKKTSSSARNDDVEYAVTFSPPSNDTLHTYNVEGTPTTFSRNDSLSSLGGDKDSRGTGSGISASPHKDHRLADRDESDSSSSIPKERHVIGQSSEDSSVAGDKIDRPIKFAVEDTPVCFSRNSSLSSLNSIDKIEKTDISYSLKSTSNEIVGAGVKPDMQQNELYNSMGDELADCDTTPSEQALLDQCINSAMPKSRLPKGEDRSRRHTKAKFLNEKSEGVVYMSTAPSGNGLTKSASLEMPAGASSDSHDGRPQSSLPHDQKSSQNLMTRSCTDTTELDPCCPTPQSSSRRSRPGNWHRQEHHSEESDGKNIIEICQEVHEPFVGDTPARETEKLGAKNVNLAMSEIHTSKIGGDAVDEDLFIENETISLVSNDYTSDTNSEISLTWSVTSDPSSAALAEDQDLLAASRRGSRPKILKPETLETSKKKSSNEENEGKAVRGRRKLLYPSKANHNGLVAKGSVKAAPSNKETPSSVGSRGVVPAGIKSSGISSVPGHKAASPRNPDIAQVLHREVAAHGGCPPLKNAMQKLGAAEQTTDPVKSGASPGVVDRVGAKKAKVTGQAAKPNVSASSNKPTGQHSPPVSTSMSSSQTSPPAGTARVASPDPNTKSPGLSRLPTAIPGSRNSNKNNKAGGTPRSSSSSSSAVSSTTSEKSEKKAGQSTSKFPNDASGGLSRGLASGIPRKFSGSPSSSMSDPARYSQSNSSDPNRHRKTMQANGKIMALQRRDGSLDRSSFTDSPLSSPPMSPSRLQPSTVKNPPASPKPSSLPPSGFKAATLPNSTLASSKSKSYNDQISKSLTYEKISSELEEKSKITCGETVKKNKETNKRVKPKGDSVESPESGVRRGEVIELCDRDDDDDDEDDVTKDVTSNSDTNILPNSSFDPNDSLENSVFQDSSCSHPEDVMHVLNSTSGSANSPDHSTSTLVQIDSSTFRKRKQDQNILDFYLQNVNTTCQSMNSFDDSAGTLQVSNSFTLDHKDQVNNENDANIIELLHQEMSESKMEKRNKHRNEKAGGKAKSSVAQGLKRLFSGRHKDKEKGLKTKSSDKESGKSKQSEKESKAKSLKSEGKEKKNGKDKKECDFFQSNVKIEPSTTWTVDDKLVCSQGTSTVTTSHNVKATSGTTTTNGQSVVSNLHNEHSKEVHEGDGSVSALDKHMTKTEMLLARRQKTNMSVGHSDEAGREGDLLATCMVTTV